MVCMGNICRSPLAQGVLQYKLGRAGLDQRVQVASAGTHSDRGSPADPRAVAAAARRGYDLAAIRSRRLVDADFERYQWLIAMDESNHRVLLERCPAGLQGRVGLLLDLAPRRDGEREVPDPYYGAPNGFERVLDLIEPACDALVARLSQQLTTPAKVNAD